jgi:hypothetical protein
VTDARTEPKVTLHIEVRDADGNVKHVETINSTPAPVSWSVRLKSLLRGK